MTIKIRFLQIDTVPYLVCFGDYITTDGATMVMTSQFVTRTMHYCPSKMNENLMISNNKYMSYVGDANYQIWVHLRGTIMLGVYFVMWSIIVVELIDKFQ